MYGASLMSISADIPVFGLFNKRKVISFFQLCSSFSMLSVVPLLQSFLLAPFLSPPLKQKRSTVKWAAVRCCFAVGSQGAILNMEFGPENVCRRPCRTSQVFLQRSGWSPGRSQTWVHVLWHRGKVEMLHHDPSYTWFLCLVHGGNTRSLTLMSP